MLLCKSHIFWTQPSIQLNSLILPWWIAVGLLSSCSMLCLYGDRSWIICRSQPHIENAGRKICEVCVMQFIFYVLQLLLIKLDLHYETYGAVENLWWSIRKTQFEKFTWICGMWSPPSRRNLNPSLPSLWKGCLECISLHVACGSFVDTFLD